MALVSKSQTSHLQEMLWILQSNKPLTDMQKQVVASSGSVGTFLLTTDGAAFVEATIEMPDIGNREDSIHKNSSSSQIMQIEKDVVKVTEAVNNLLNPFDVDNTDVLYCLSSGARVSEQTTTDRMSAI